MWYNSAMSEMITFDSGLRLIVTPNPAVRSASVGVFVKAGSVYERPEQGGISHLLEHMLFKGTKKRTAFDIANEIDSLGAQINAYTAKSSTCYHTLSRDVHAAECMEVLADMYFDATFLSDEFAKERKVVLEELAESEDTPDDLCLEKLSSAFFKGHALGRSILGTAATLKEMRPEDLTAYRDSHYVSGGTVISVAGNVTVDDARGMVTELFEKRYIAGHIKLYAAIVIFVFLIPYSTSVYQGIGYLSEAVFGLDFIWCVVIMAVLVGIYLFVGGYFANAVSNFIQGIIMLIGVVVMIVLMLKAPEVNGIEGLKKLIDSGYGFFPDATTTATGIWFDTPAAQLIFNLMLTSFGIWAVPQSVQKFFAIRNDRAVLQGSVISTVFALIVGGGAYFNGSLARLFYPEMPADSSNIIPNILLSNEMMSYAVLGLIFVLVLSASMSTLSSLALVSSSSVCVDIYRGYINRGATDKQVNILARVLCFVFVVISALFAIFEVDAIVTLMSLSWGTLAGCFLGPYIYGLYWKRANKVGAYASITATLVTTITLIFVFDKVAGGESFTELLSLGIKRAAVIGVFCMIESMIVTPIASLIGEAAARKKGIRLNSEEPAEAESSETASAAE